MSVERLVQAWTQRLLFQLQKGTLGSDGKWTYAAIPRVEIEGTTVTLVLKNSAGTEIATTGDTGWYDLDAAIVYYDPDSTDLLAADSPVTAHWKIHDVSGKDVYIPKGPPDVWIISAQ
jgi:hypothetical protein